MESEAGHYTLFIDLALTYLPEDQVRPRWKAWLTHEAAVMQTLELRGDRMH
jgi:tRNA-(ms[2]io[6]A)-hydroxylase